MQKSMSFANPFAVMVSFGCLSAGQAFIEIRQTNTPGKTRRMALSNWNLLDWRGCNAIMPLRFSPPLPVRAAQHYRFSLVEKPIPRNAFRRTTGQVQAEKAKRPLRAPVVTPTAGNDPDVPHPIQISTMQLTSHCRTRTLGHTYSLFDETDAITEKYYQQDVRTKSTS